MDNDDDNDHDDDDGRHTLNLSILQADRAFGSFTDSVSVGTVCFWGIGKA